MSFAKQVFLQKILLIVLITLLVSNKSISQTKLEKVKFSRIESSTGLSNSSISTILQDSKGFLWVGTGDGLNRFDGYEFAVFRNDAKDTTSLLKNPIKRIFEDTKGNIWISTGNGGLHIYDRPQNRFKRFKEYSFDCEIRVITEDALSQVWIGGIKSKKAFVARYIPEKGEWKNYDIMPSIRPIISFIPTASTHQFWLTIDNTGFYKWDLNTNSLESYTSDKNNKNKSEGIISNDFNDAISDGSTIWIATVDGLIKFDTLTKISKNYTVQLSNKNNQPGLLVNNILNLCKDGNYLWAGTENGGLSRLDTRTGEFKTFIYNRNDFSSIVGNSIWALYRDRQGRIWIGTYSNGLCVIDKLKYKFAELDVALENNIVNAIYEDSKKRLWIGTEEGIAIKDKNKLDYIKIPAPSIGNSYPVLSIFEDSRRQLWCGTWTGGINRWDEQLHSFVSYLPMVDNSRSLSNPNVFAINEDARSGNLLVGTFGGLNILTDASKGTFDKMRDSVYEFNNYIQTIYRDKKNSIWIGTLEELLLLDAKEKKLTRINPSDTSLISGTVNCLLEDSKNRLWVGTSTGLTLLVNKKLTSRYTTLDGLPNSNVKGIQEDDHGNLWVSTLNGLSKLNPDKKTFVNYTVGDGLVSNEFRRNVSLKSKDGFLFFGGKGVNLFHPDSIHSNPTVPPVYLTDLKIFNRSVAIGELDSLLEKSVIETDRVTLHEKYNFFSIDFVALNFSSSNKNQYAYKLEGFDKDWVYTNSNRTATFTNLDPGTYTFRVKASNNDGLWNEKGALLTIHILPFWWRTLWFKTILVVLAIALILLYIHLRVKYIKKQNEELEKLVAIRTDEIAAQNEELQMHQEELTMQNGALQESKKQQLDMLTQSIVEKSNIINHISSELELLKSKPQVEQAQVERFNRILNSTILTADDWDNFKKTFDEVYPSFIASLRFKYPQLTNAELRLCALVKLRLSLKESSAMLGVSPESVKQSRYRLKKKLNIPEVESLDDFIRNSTT